MSWKFLAWGIRGRELRDGRAQKGERARLQYVSYGAVRRKPDPWARGVQPPAAWNGEGILLDREEQTLPRLHSHRIR